MKIDKEFLNRFEDMDDMFDFIIECIQKCTHYWSIFSKLNINEENGEVSKEILMSIVGSEFDDQYPKIFPVIEKRDDGNIITSLILEEKKDNGTQRPI